MQGNSKPQISVWGFLWKYVKEAKYMVPSLLLVFFIGSFLMRLQTYIVAEMIGVLSNAAAYPDIAVVLIKYLAIFAIILVVLTAGDSMRRILEAHFIPFFTSRLAKDLFVMVHKHSTRFFEEEMAGNITGKVRNILNNVEHMYFNILFGISVPLIEIGMSLSFIAFANKYLAVILGVLNLLFLGLTIYFRKQISSYAAVRSKLRAVSTGIFVDGITNNSLVKSFASYFYEKLLYFKAVRSAAKAQKKELLKIAMLNWYSKSVFDVLTLASYGLTFYFWYKYGLSIADVVLVTALIGTFVGAIRQMGYVASSFAQIYGSIEDGLELLNQPCEVIDKAQAGILKVKKNNIEFSKIVYHYKNNKPLFKNFSLSIAENEKIGLVGYSGSGKSTLIKLLARCYDLQGGKILIDGQDISDVTQQSLRRNIAVIPQESTLFNRSIMDNIRYGNPKASSRQVIAAAKKAYIHDFIMSLPDKYNSKVGERGVMLSGGERQRIAIARAILKNAPILILDEATSALDSESEHYIQQSLKELMKGKTVIAIAHRLSTLKEMDRLVVMEKGKIVESGSHQELISRQGLYSRFYDLQARLLAAETAD